MKDHQVNCKCWYLTTHRTRQFDVQEKKQITTSSGFDGFLQFSSGLHFPLHDFVVVSSELWNL